MSTRNSDRPLDTYIEAYHTNQQVENLSPRTVDSNHWRLSRYRLWLGAQVDHDPLLCDFTIDNTKQYVLALRQRKPYEGHPRHPAIEDRPLTDQTVESHTRSLKAFAKWLFKERATKDDVLKGFKTPKAEQTLIEPLTDDEIKRMFKALNTRTDSGARNYAICWLFLDTGVRSSELCGLTVDDVHIDEPRGWIKVKGKGRKERIVYLGRGCQQAMLYYANFVREGALGKSFFLSRAGRPMQRVVIQKMFFHLRESCGIERLHAHLLRHTYASQFLAHGGDAISLQRNLGHTTMKMTEHYVELNEQQMAGIKERVSPMDILGLPPMKRRYNRTSKKNE